METVGYVDCDELLVCSIWLSSELMDRQLIPHLDANSGSKALLPQLSMVIGVTLMDCYVFYVYGLNGRCVVQNVVCYVYVSVGIRLNVNHYFPLVSNLLCGEMVFYVLLLKGIIDKG